MSLNILVAGATGRLGNVVSELLARGHAVRAMTRSLSSAVADTLRSAGAEVMYGDLEVPARLVAAATGVDAVFAAGTLHKAGPDGDIRHGINITDAIRAARVPHFVYVSVAGAETDAAVPLFHVGFGGDIPALREVFPDVHWHRFEEWAADQNWREGSDVTHRAT